ncbi:hydroxyectoine utilization dehydratase EutB [Labrys sp. LIt4]|uniref:hydroxyectoine utilization dehydratase EutB n=1 Tax=Labrys sp. LIt4 TaxID=2821355 RepID=UPI001ADFAA36|nr:hydroxyectoine utilization dehydratase EutB [Labrys sp. LIt4]MBP0581050.1 hydroxyectoine utilization dehydratase EutB [Labrys sp. LIt4]
MPVSVTIDEIKAAQARIAGHVVRTPLRHAPSLSHDNSPVHLKLETRQTTGSFKLRGATNAVLSLKTAPTRGATGVVTASTGNHGRAVAHAAKARGIRAVVCMSHLVPENKVEAVRSLGAEVRIVGHSQDDAQEEVDRLVAEENLAEIPPFDHPAVIAGQGTIGLEIIEDMPEVELVLVPLSGGGLAGGIAAAVKALRPRTKVVGISMARGAAMHASLLAGKPVQVEELPTLADSLGGGIGLANHYSFALCRDFLDEVVLLTEEEVATGIRHAFTAEGEIVEGAAGVGIAALLAGKVKPPGPTAVVVSGRNIDPGLHRRIVEQGVAA